MGWDNPPVPWRELERRLSWDMTRQDGSEPAGVVRGRFGPQPAQDDGPPWAELHCHSSYSFLDGASSPAELVAEAARQGVQALALTDHDGMYGVAQFAQAAAQQAEQTGIPLSTIFGAELSLGRGGRSYRPSEPGLRPGERPVLSAGTAAGHGKPLVTGPANRASGPVSGRCAGEVPPRGAERSGGFRGVVPPGQHSAAGGSGGSSPRASTRASARAGTPDPEGEHLLVLARDAEGYRRLCTVISAAQLAGGEKGRPVYDRSALASAHDGHWAVLTGCRKGAVPAALAAGGPEAALRELRAMIAMFGPGNVMVELTFHDQPGDDERNEALAGLAEAAGVGVVATGNVHYASPSQARLAETLAAIRARRSLDEMDGWLPASGAAYIRSGAEMSRRLRRFPGVQERTVELARSCTFDFRVLAPGLPDFGVPEGYTEMSWLRALVAEQAPKRYGPPGAEWEPGAYRQIEHELDVIEGLKFPGYFLLVHDIVRFCENRTILCQGRGSAANSAVCYALGITSVDAVRHGLLFERFLSAGRDGPPDIDLDIEHRRREEVIQYVYGAYGRGRAAQVANVISYRPRMALRDAGRALGHPPAELDAWSRRAGPGEAAGKDADVPADVAALAEQMQQLPRHLGIHSGGMVICDRPVGEVCPVEWARMPGRSVLQWDKDDCAYAGLVKFDLLGLGMLSALHDCFDLVEVHYGHRWSLNSIPQEDAGVYAMLQAADTVGVFQVESRAQMSTLPRLRPEKFYDLVVEVALIRPGPIQGGSVHPYLRRRAGAEERLIPHESMRAALGKTYGVPLFQEQMMQLAIDCAGFTPAESDKLRQAMSSKRAPERIEELRQRLLGGMEQRGIPGPVAEDVYQKILAFSSYGFPESHAISFAYLVYASAWLKHYYPAAFTAALLRNQPMGFYSPASLISDVRRHGVEVRGVDVNASSDLATLESAGRSLTPAVPSRPVPVPSSQPGTHPAAPQPAIRLGLRGVRNLGADTAAAVAAGRPYAGLEDFARRTRLPAAALEALAAGGAFGCFGVTRREAMWAAGAAAGIRPAQLPGTTPGLVAPGLPVMTPTEETIADLWATGVFGTHPLQHIRAELEEQGVAAIAALPTVPAGGAIVVGGLVTHRQRPPHGGRRGVPQPGGRDRDGQRHLPAAGVGAFPPGGRGVGCAAH
jgi:error-prone DNA polymerase